MVSVEVFTLTFIIFMAPPTTAPVKLIMVTGENNNKFYNMTPNGSTFTAEWGRVGVTSTTTTYPLSKWNSQYNSKIKKGYKDVTDLVKTPVKTSKQTQSDIANPAIRNIFDKLMGFAKMSVKTNYTISSDIVTPAQVTEAQSIVDELTVLAKIGAKKKEVNDILTHLYTVIPRRMKKVQDHLLSTNVQDNKDLQFFRSIIDNEQKTLDVMAGQVQIHHTDDSTGPAGHTILDTLGISVEVAGDADIVLVKKLMATDAIEFRSVFRVQHGVSQKRFETQLTKASDQKKDLFWHGSRNENWISILQTGLKIRPSNAVLTGSMFGDGIYFADKYRKSAGYTSLSGSYWARGSSNSAFLALMEVHLGHQLVISRHNHDCYKYNKSYLQKLGNYDSVFAKGGADLINNEFVVYDDAQSTIKYLVEVGR